MMKKITAILLIVCLSLSFVFAQGAESPVTPFSSPAGMTGLILEATGYGLFIGGGVVASSDLGVALALMQIAPIASVSGAWLTQSFMQKTNQFWVDHGVLFNGQKYLKNSRTCAIITTVFGAGALFLPLVMEDEAGTITSIVCAGVSVCTDMIGLYGVRLGWTKALNEAILKSKVDWKAIQKRK